MRLIVFFFFFFFWGGGGGGGCGCFQPFLFSSHLSFLEKMVTDGVDSTIDVPCFPFHAADFIPPESLFHARFKLCMN